MIFESLKIGKSIMQHTKITVRPNIKKSFKVHKLLFIYDFINNIFKKPKF